MPKKAVFSKKQIFDQAFVLFETKGLESITARNLGKALSSSPAPIYAHYDSITELKNELISVAKNRFLEYLKRPVTDKIYLNIGIGICTFAKENKQLFISIFLREQSFSDLIREFRDIIKIEMDKDHRFDNLSNEFKDMLFFDCWSYAHGLSTLIATGFFPEGNEPDEEYIKERLMQGAATMLYKRLEDYNNSQKK